MRVLVVHNSYRSDSPSGEEKVVDSDIALLRDAGVEVMTYRRGSDEIADMSLVTKVTSVARPIYSSQALREVRSLLEERRPDVMHVHNVYPLISPWVVRVAADLGIPVVQTVHNYRHVCVRGDFYRDRRICTSCVGKRVPWPAVLHGCYRGSRPQSVVMASSLATHVPTWQRVDRFLPVTAFMGAHLEAMGIAASRITVKPNSAPDPGAPPAPGRTLLYVGRLTEEKGLRDLISAWPATPRTAFDRLVIAGDGPLRDEVVAATGRLDAVEYLGAVSSAVVGELMNAAGAIVVPSAWYEGFPVTIVEAFARGRAVVATDVGSLSSIVDDAVGWKFQPGQLAGALATVTPEALATRGATARSRYLDQFTPSAVTAALRKIYDDVIAAHVPQPA